jgi:hypothetical protein
MGVFDPSTSTVPTKVTTNTPNADIQPYVSDVLSKGKALLDAGTPAYTGQMTAGPSELQNEAWSGLSGLTLPTSMTEASSRLGDLSNQAANYKFDASKINEYMNPYIQQALNPQLEEMRRQSQINLLPYLAKVTQQGGYGGGREAILRSDANRNLLAEQNKVTGQGYKDAYDNAMKAAQYASDLGLKGITSGIQASQAQANAGAQEASYGLQNLQALSTAGKTQQEQNQASLNSQYNEWLRQLKYMPEALKNQQQLIQGMPGGSTASEYGAKPSSFQQLTGTAAGVASLVKNLKDAGLTQDVISNMLKSMGINLSGSGATTSTDAVTADVQTALENQGYTLDPNGSGYMIKDGNRYALDGNNNPVLVGPVESGGGSGSMVDDGATKYQNYSEAPTNTNSNSSYYPNYSEAPDDEDQEYDTTTNN